MAEGMLQVPVELAEAMAKAGLSPGGAKLLSRLPHRRIELHPRRGFGRPHIDANDAVYVRVGLLAKCRTTQSPRRQIVALHYPGEIILPCVSSAGDVLEAITTSEIVVISREDFYKAVHDVPQLAIACIRGLQREAAISEQWLLNCGSRDTRTRVAHLLCELAVRSGVSQDKPTFVNPFTQSQIAEMTGQTNVNVNRVLSDLEQTQLLTREGRSITITNWREFARVANFTPEYLQ